MKVALIFVDNLRIGGYQRLAIDEAYALSDRGVKTMIVSLEQTGPSQLGNNFANIESDLLARKGIRIEEFPASRIKLYFALRSLMKSLDFSAIVISHSLRSSFVLKLVQLSTHNARYTINTKIHQIPHLSDVKQRLKRFLYSQFTDNLYCFSEAVITNWNSQFGRSIEVLLRQGRQMRLLRNGVYLPRIPALSPVPNTRNPRIIFLGRITFWKGLEILNDIAQIRDLSSFDFLLIVPSYTEDEVSELRATLGDRLRIISGKSINQIQFFSGDIHVYPTQYPFNSSSTESISLNCLELAVVGIPSLITHGGQLTWTESEFYNYFIEVDWNDTAEVAKKIQYASLEPICRRTHSRLLELVDINNEINELLK